MTIIAIALFVLALVYGFNSIMMLKNGKDVVVSMLMNTEQNEQVNFNFRLSAGSDKDTMVAKINEVFELSEARRQYQTKRMETLREEAIKRAEAMNELEGNVSKLAQAKKEK